MASKSREQHSKEQHAKGMSPYVSGIIVAVVLAILTIVEYYVGILYPYPTPLFLLALLKAILVLYFFMHVYRLWRADEGSH